MTTDVRYLVNRARALTEDDFYQRPFTTLTTIRLLCDAIEGHDQTEETGDHPDLAAINGRLA